MVSSIQSRRLFGNEVFVRNQIWSSGKNRLNVIILAGQSNMAGRGGIFNNTWDGVTPPECASRPEIVRLNDNLEWEEAKEPLHQGLNTNCPDAVGTGVPGIGPGMPFSNSLLRMDPDFGEIRLVPCAVGGTLLQQWSQGSCLYRRLLTRVQATLSDGGELRGMLWYQGESDAKDDNKTDLSTYGSRLEQFFTDLRTDLDAPWLPIVQVALASGSENVENLGIVRNAQLNTSLPNVKCVDALGLELLGDKLHLTTSSQIRLGRWLADAFLQFFN